MVTMRNIFMEVVTMPRPKGSKNKKSTKAVSDFTVQIEERKAAKADLEKEQETILGVIKSNQDRLKDVRKDIRSVEKEIAGLEAKKAQADAAASAARIQEEVQKRVAELAAEGKSLEEILEKLK